MGGNSGSRSGTKYTGAAEERGIRVRGIGIGLMSFAIGAGLGIFCLLLCIAGNGGLMSRHADWGRQETGYRYTRGKGRGEMKDRKIISRVASF